MGEMMTDNSTGNSSLKHEPLVHIHGPGLTLEHRTHMLKDMCQLRIPLLPHPQNQSKDPALSRHVRRRLDLCQSHSQKNSYHPQILGQQSIDPQLSKDPLRLEEIYRLSQTCVI